MTLLQTPGEALIALCQEAKKEVLLVSPFIKVNSLKRVLASIPKEVETITIVTRWIPSEVALGVSDLEVFDILIKRANATLLLHPCLHAKYYRADDQSLAGSANITAKGLGWCSMPNIEILTGVSPEDSDIKALENMLKNQAIIATESIRDAVQEAADRIRKEVELLEEPPQTVIALNHMWLPTCIKPEYLYKIYSGQGTSSLISSIVETGKQDIKALNLLPGINESDFRKYVAAIFEHTPPVQEIHTLSIDSGVASDTAEIVIEKYRVQILSPHYDAKVYWQVFKEWLLFFFPQRYRVKAVAEVLEVAKEIK